MLRPNAAPTSPLADSTGSATVARRVNWVAAVSAAGSAGSMATSAWGSPRRATESMRCPAVFWNTSLSGTPAASGVRASSVSAMPGMHALAGTAFRKPIT